MKVISARVPKDVVDMIETACKQRKMSKSAYILEMVSTPLPIKMESGGIINKKVELPDELNALLSGVGGLGVGLLTFRLMKSYMPTDKFTPEEIDVYAGVAAVACGFLSGYGIKKLLEDK